MLFKTNFVTYQGIYKVIDTDKLNVPTSEGRRTILSNHMPIMLSLEIGIIETNNEKLSHFITDGAVLYFKDNVAEIVANEIIDVEEINIDDLNKEKIKVEKEKTKAKNDFELEKVELKLKIINTKIEAYKKYVEGL